MNLNINRSDIEKLIAYHGTGYTDWTIAEEPVELIQAYSKLKRWENSKYGGADSDYLKLKNNLIEEMADVCIILEMIQVMHDIKEEYIQKLVDLKMKRNLVRAGVHSTLTKADIDELLKNENTPIFIDYECAKDCCNSNNEFKIVCRKCGECGRVFDAGILLNAH